MTTRRSVAGVAMAVVATIGLVAASHFPMRLHTSDDAVVRLAWSARPERMEVCRRLSEDELAGVPQHMRQSVVCDGFTASYRLDVLRDDSLHVSRTVRGGGLRRDRQLYVYRELVVPSGVPTTVEVRMTRVERAEDDVAVDGEVGEDAGLSPGDPRQRAERENQERLRRVADEVPARLVLRATVTPGPRDVLLVTYDRGERRLVLVGGSQ